MPHYTDFMNIRNILLLLIFAVSIPCIARADRSNGKTSEAITSFLYEEGLLPGEALSLRTGLDITPRRMISEAGVSRSFKTISDAFDVPVMASPPTITRTAGASTTLANFTFFGPSSGAWTLSPIPVSSVGGFLRGTYSTALQWTASFWTDADIMELYFNGAATSMAISCNGELIQAAAITENSGAVLYKLEFSDVRPRLIQVLGQNLQFGGVFTNGISSRTTCWPAPTVLRPPLVLIMSDSYGVGVGGIFGQSFAQAFGRALGCRTYVEAISSSGWLTTTPNTPLERFTNKQALLLEQPSLVVSCLGYNDAGGNMTTLGTNYAAWFAAVKAAWPSVPIYTVGPWTPQGSTANLTLVKNALSTACTAAGGTFVDFENVVSVGNKNIWVGGDFVHFNGVGHQFGGCRLAQRFVDLGLWPLP